MPTYTYVCASCGHRYDAFQNMTATPDTVCPECEGTVERLIGAGSGIVFKGSGFYVTDYRKGGSSGGGESSDSGSSSGSSKSSSSSSSSSGAASATPAKSEPAKSTGSSGSSGGSSDS